MRKYIYVLFAVFLGTNLFAQKKLPPGWQSSLVEIDASGKLVYHPDERGNVIPDFSRVGYHHGDKAIPDYPVTVEVAPLAGTDNRQHIQDAIDKVSSLPADADGHRGVVLLKRGTYPVHGTLFIRTSGVVLKGEGDNVHETRLLAIGTTKFPLISVCGTGRLAEIPNTRTKITDKFVPVGTCELNVSSASPYKVGDRIIVFRPGTERWIHDLRMDRIVERKGTKQWQPKEYNLSYEREITRIEGNKLYIDNPIVMQMEEKYGGGEVFKYEFTGRISEVGVSNLCLESEFKDYEDTQHGWIGVQIDKAENCWVRNVTCRYFGYAAVSCEVFAKNITVTDCRCLETKSVITGGLRYSFNNWGQQNLFMNCQATEGRHDFVTGARVCGPNVFYNCTASQTYADIGPHHRWASGTLYDNIVTDGEINVQDRGNMGSGHGWSGVTQVLWNCRVRRAAIQNPWVSGDNYSIGTKGEKYPGHFKDRPYGHWEGQNEINVFPRSLYIAQLMARHGLDLTILTK